MPDPKLQALLASRYLSGPKAEAILSRYGEVEVKKRRKKRRKEEREGASSSGLILRDDEEDSWKSSEANEADEVSPQVVPLDPSGSSSKFKRVAWSRTLAAVGDGVDHPSGDREEELDEEDRPTLAGLRTKEEIRAERLAREARTRREAEEKERQDRASSGKGKSDDSRKEEETVYRDSSGRRIDVKAEEEERRRFQLEEERKRKEREEWGKGLVQKREVEERRKRLERIKDEKVSRGAEDREMNRQLKQVEHWNDPALAFITKKRDRGPQKPKYQGPPPPPNRFGIPPGYRWDGVDRSNGFEKKLFQRKNQLSREEAERRAWSQSDM
ncbi:hypothetical protein IE53DRAFT_407217 [Violaceomyces palustris]|uniref:Uncharacterized protein n=1 Tax=Violaceomyces palustris TaxID=1673888 RepID=A0ACD0NQS4_9BASI|nr:hypothetical protein IE53DRAFT_407217 [Violaceomyces palustris]